MIFHAMLLLLDWKDFAVVLCVALAVAAQTFTQ
jgi:hypothetical protein